MTGMIDMHCHILPDVDDGPELIEESIEMARLASYSGVETIVVTPHSFPALGDSEYSPMVREATRYLQMKLDEKCIPVKLISGMEIMAGTEVPYMLEEHRLLTLGNTRYVLLEFPFDEITVGMEHMFDSLFEAGYIPVVAHPERYYAIQDDPFEVRKWVDRGCRIQINKGSLLGRFGTSARETAVRLVQSGSVFAVASDAHGSERRTPHMTEVEKFMLEIFSKSTTEKLLRDNPARLLGINNGNG